MKAVTARLPRGDDWVYEPKWDGHRALVRAHAGTVDVVSSTGKARLASWPWLADITLQIDDPGTGDWVFDGEVVAMDDDGKHGFQHVGRPDRPHAFVAFDMLVADGVDLQSTPWHQRRERLLDVLRPTPQIFVTPVTDDGDALMAATLANGFEGVIAKRRNSIYQPGRRSPSWVKVKHRFEQEMVIGGYQTGRGSRSSSFGSLLVGVYEGASLRFASGVGTGFTDKSLRDVQARLAALVSPTCPFDPEPKLPRGKAIWVLPELVAQVAFMEWTEFGHLRHPVFHGLRDDKPAATVVREV